jgi:hypothetical protein
VSRVLVLVGSSEGDTGARVVTDSRLVVRGCWVPHQGSSIFARAVSVARHSFADGTRSMARSGHDYSGSSRSSTSPCVVGVMPISSARVVVSECAHAVLAKQRISPSRRP